MESLPQYKDIFSASHKKHVSKKVFAGFVFVFLLALIAYLSAATTFLTSFYHVFILFFVVNIYDLLILESDYFVIVKSQ